MTKRLLCASSALALMASCAHAAILPATPSTVYAVTAAAQPGDTVQLASGTYVLDEWNIKKTGEVVIGPAPGAKVTASEINADNSTFLTFRGIAVAMSAATQHGVEAWGSSHVTFDGLTITGSSCTALAGTGVSLRNLTNAMVLVENSTISCVGSGIGLTDADGVTIDHNTLHDIQTDGIIGGGVSNIVVSNNTEYGFHTAGGGHPDFIQFFDDGTVYPSKTVSIFGNLLYRGSGDLVQGIFIEDGSAYDVHDNQLYGTMYNGIAFARTQGIALAHNYVQSLAYTAANPPPGQGEPDTGTWIMLRQTVNNATLANNAAPTVIIGVAGEPQPTGWTEIGTTKTAAAAPGDMTQYNAWIAKTDATASTPPPVVVSPPVVTTPAPPAVNPLQATVDSLTAQVATDKTTIAGLQAQVAAAPTRATVDGLNAQIAALKAQLAALQASTTATQLKAAQTALAAANATLANIRKAGGWK